MSYEPCLCGDPACPSCSPASAVAMVCSTCGWRGKRHECGSEEFEVGDAIDLCPACGADANEDEHWFDGEEAGE